MRGSSPPWPTDSAAGLGSSQTSSHTSWLRNKQATQSHDCHVTTRLRLTEECGEEFKGDQLVVLEHLDEGEDQSREVGGLSKYGGPVS